MHEYGANIRRARERRQMKQEELARMVGVKRETLSRIERGKQYPSIPLMERIAKTLGVPVVELLKPNVDDMVS